MKGKLIIINWILSLTGLTVVEPFWATMCGFAWFCGSTLLINHADRKGWMKGFWASRLGKLLNTEED
jgi:hypothetical protein